MGRQRHNYQSLFHFAAALLILAGCAPQEREAIKVCPGKRSATEVLSVLRSRTKNTKSLKANGQCYLQYYAEGKKHKENFPVKLWVNPVRSPRQQGAAIRSLTSNGVNPPAEIYLQGDVAFDAKAIALGSNEDEFWLSMKPKEISSYWWGRWSEETCFAKLTISPKLLLEALGIAVVGSEKKGRENWSLSNEGAFDVLTKREGQSETQKIYISNCDYLVRKIEYLDGGQAVVVTELDKYNEVAGGFFVPSAIKIINRTGDSNKDSDSVTLTLKSIKPVDITLRQRKALFTRPQPRGFKHIYKIIGADMIEQPQ